MASLSPGQTLLRVRFGLKGDAFWTNSGTASQSDLQASMTNFTSFGIVTTVGIGTEPVPNPATSPLDQNPPTSRYLYLATTTMSLTSFSGTSSTWTMGFEYPFMDVSTEGMVKATGFVAPDTLNVWITIGTSAGAWTTPTVGDIAWYSYWYSLLHS